MLAAVLMLALVVQAGEAAAVTAECRAPEAPPVIRPVKPTRPSTPSCVDEARARHNCRPAVYAAFERELTAYGEAFNAYVDTLNDYTAALSDYAAAANRYSICERKLAGPEGLIQG